MLKGLTDGLKPFLNKVLIEDAKQSNFVQSGYIDLYTDNLKKSPSIDTESKIKLTFKCDLKAKFSKAVHLQEEQIKTILSNLHFSVRAFTDKEQFKTFLALDKKSDYFLHFTQGGNSINTTFHDSPVIKDLLNYIYYDGNIMCVNIPAQFHEKFTFNSNNNPSFLAYGIALYSNNEVLPGTTISEVIFDGGQIPAQTGFFTIGNAFQYRGEERTLFKTKVFTDIQDKDPVEMANLFFGAPGDIWVGPHHFSLIANSKDPNVGKYRAMAGAAHIPNVPHPFLDFNVKSNDKIVDFRSIAKIEELFKYNTDIYEKLLASTSDVLYTGGKKKNTIDELVNNKAIVSEAHYSIRSIKQSTSTKDVVNLFFAIDKMMLLKETTKLPGLLDKLIHLNPSFGAEFVKNINIFHFEIARINKNTGESNNLIVGNNDITFDDFKVENHLGNNISKGYRLNQKTNIQIKNQESVTFYEFRDGSLDNSKYDKNDYAYKIILKFKDPLISWLKERLAQSSKIIKDLDELLLKTQLKIYDNSRQKYVGVFDKYQNRLNPKFVDQALKNDPDAKLPLTFIFANDELPASVEEAFPLINRFEAPFALDSLNVLMASLNSYDDLEPKENFYGGLYESLAVNNYIRNSLKLSSTSPTLIQKVRSLVFLMNDRLIKSLGLYTTENITKKDIGFTYADYIQSSPVKNAGVFVTEFEHTFNTSIDMSKTKNYFDWIPEALGTPEDNLKSVQVLEYVNAVRRIGVDLLSSKGKSQVDEVAHYSYSFVPLLGANLSLFNNTWMHPHDLKRDGVALIQNENLQSTRKKLFDRITSNLESVTLPETLSFYGIRFLIQNENLLLDIMTDRIAEDQQSIEFNDNWGQSFEPAGQASSSENQISYSGYGSVEDPDYDWQGTSKENYPLVLARSLINLLNSDNIQGFRNRDFFKEMFLVPKFAESPDAFGDKSLPYIINLFKTLTIADSNQNGLVKENLMNILFFSQGGELKINSYALYILLLGLFGKVYYLESFEQGALSDKLTPSSYANRNLVNSMQWKPITRAILDQPGTDEELFCKIELLEDGVFLDKNIVDLYRNYYSYNQYFYIKPGLLVYDSPARSETPELAQRQALDPRSPSAQEDVNRFFNNTDQRRLETEMCSTSRVRIPIKPVDR